MQGLLELANVPYVGPGVLASAVGHGQGGDARDVLPRTGCRSRPGNRSSAPRVGARSPGASSSRAVARPAAVREAGQPRIERRHFEGQGRRRAARGGDRHALEFDRKVVVEWGVPDAREIECAVLGNDDPQASVPGEVDSRRASSTITKPSISTRDRARSIPADLDAEQAREVQRLAIAAFRAIDAAGMSRVDFLLLAADRRDLPQRDQHDPGLHHHQHVRQDVGGQRHHLPGAGRSADSARARTSRRQAATAHERDVTATATRPATSDRASSRHASPPCDVSAVWPLRALQLSPSRPAAPIRGAAPARAARCARAYDAILDADFDQRRSATARRRLRPAPALRATVMRPSSRLVADRARSRRPRATTPAFDASGRSRRSPAPKRWTTARAGTRRGVVCTRRRLRRARAVARAARVNGSPRRATASASRRRSSGRWRSIPTLHDAEVRPRHVPLLRRRRAGGAAAAALAAAAAGRRSRTRACAQMLEARDRGIVVRGEADYQFHLIYLWYEHSASDALDAHARSADALSAQPALPPHRGRDRTTSTSTTRAASEQTLRRARSRTRRTQRGSTPRWRSPRARADTQSRARASAHARRADASTESATTATEICDCESARC